MAKISPLVLIGGAAAAYFIFGSKKAKPSPVAQQSKVVNGDKVFPGYKIIGNCESIEMTNPVDAAGAYAFTIGTEKSLLDQKIDKIFGSKKCLDLLATNTKNTEKAKNVYFLLESMYAGFDAANPDVDSEKLIQALQLMHKALGLKGIEYVPYNYLVVLKSRSKKGYESPGYIIAACKSLLIKNQEAAFEEAYNAGKNHAGDYTNWTKALIGNCSVDQIVMGLKDYYTLYVYSTAGMMKGNKENLPKLQSALIEFANEMKADTGIEVIPPTVQELSDIIDQYEG